MFYIHAQKMWGECTPWLCHEASDLPSMQFTPLSLHAAGCAISVVCSVSFVVAIISVITALVLVSFVHVVLATDVCLEFPVHMPSAGVPATCGVGRSLQVSTAN